MTEAILSICPVCDNPNLEGDANHIKCTQCGLKVSEKKPFLFFGAKDRYVVETIGEAYSVARLGLVGQVFTLNDVKRFRESVYSDETLAAFADGNLDDLNLPSSTLAQILLEQLREECYVWVSKLRRAHGPVLTEGGDRFPQGDIPTGNLIWKDKGNLFLTNVRLVFPSNSFTFIRIDRKLTGLKTFNNGLAVQRKGEDFATYFVGCHAHQAALVGAYIQGKVPALQREAQKIEQAS